MNARRLLALGVAIGIAAALFLWPSDEKRIRALLSEGIQAVEAENIEAVMSKVSFSYRDDQGFTYLTLREWLKREFQALSEIDVEQGDLSVRIKGDQATAEVTARVLATEGSMRGYIAGDPKEPARLTFSLARERSRWLVTGCRRTDAPGL